MRIGLWALLVAGIGLFPADASAYPMEIPGREDLVDWMDRSEVVCRGLVTDVVKEEGKETAVIRVERLYKGEVPGGKFEIISDTSRWCMRPSLNKRALFFIKRVNGRAELLGCQEGKLAAVSQTGETWHGSGQITLRNDLLEALRVGSREEKMTALEQLVGLKARRAIPEIRSFLGGKDMGLNVTARWALIELGDYSELKNLPDECKKDTGEGESPVLWWHVRHAIQDITDKSTVPDLISLTKSGGDQILKEFMDQTFVDPAVSALGGIRSPESVPRLIELLDYPGDMNVRYGALMVLDSIEPGVMLDKPGRGLYMASPDQYVNVWNKWWAETGRRKYFFRAHWLWFVVPLAGLILWLLSLLWRRLRARPAAGATP